MNLVFKNILLLALSIISSVVMADVISVENSWNTPWYSSVANKTSTKATRDSSVEYTIDDSNELKKINIKTSHSSADFDKFEYDSKFIYSGDDTNILVIDHAECAYNNFGIWQLGRGASNGTMGAFVAGRETKTAQIPVTGKAVFSGHSVGQYVDKFGRQSLSASNLEMGVDFSSRSIDFKTSDTILIPVDSRPNFKNNQLDLTGTLNWQQDTNAFTGKVTTANDSLAGAADGSFYGPSAKEAAGVFALSPSTGAGVESYIGAFGATTQP